MFLIKKSEEGSGCEWVWLLLGGEKTILHSQLEIVLRDTSFSRKENERFWPYFFSWDGAGNRSVYFSACATCMHRTQQQCTLSWTPIVLTNTASMDLGVDWFGCLRRFSKSIIINYYVVPCFSVFPSGIRFIFSKGLPEILQQQLCMACIG